MKRGNGKLFFLFLFALVAILSYFVVKPFLSAILGGALLAYITFPVYKWMKPKVRSSTVASLIVAVLVIFVITVPALLTLNHLTTQAQSLYLKTKDIYSADNTVECDPSSVLCRTVVSFRATLESEGAQEYVTGFAGRAVNWITEKAAQFVLNLPNIIMLIFVTIFTMFYLLKDGKTLFYRIVKTLPVRKTHQEKLVKQFGDVTNAVIFGTIVVAIVQGIVAALGFWIFGISGFLWWGIITMLLGLIPFIGSWLIWLPASIYLALAGYLGGEPGLIIKGVLLFLYGIFVISMVDNVLKPILVAGKSKVHPLLILFGALGGLLAFGFIGLLLGPVLLGLLQTLFSIYEKEMRH